MVALLILLQESATDFNDIGKLMLGGFAAAVILAVAFTFFRLKVRERNPHKSSFTSIGSTSNDRD
jgi:hypothetical protein